MIETKNTGLSRRRLIKCGLAGLAVTVGHGALSAIPQVSTSPVQAASNGDLVLVNGTFVDGRGTVASALTIKNGRIINAGQALPLGPGAKTIDLRGGPLFRVSLMHTCTTLVPR